MLVTADQIPYHNRRVRATCIGAGHIHCTDCDQALGLVPRSVEERKDFLSICSACREIRNRSRCDYCLIGEEDLRWVQLRCRSGSKQDREWQPPKRVCWHCRVRLHGQFRYVKRMSSEGAEAFACCVCGSPWNWVYCPGPDAGVALYCDPCLMKTFGEVVPLGARRYDPKIDGPRRGQEVAHEGA